MINRPLISILTIVKNGQQYIKPYLKSISSQTYPNIELIIQDGKSSDKTVEIINNFKKNSNLKIYLESAEDHSGAEAFNKAISRSHGLIACMINADDILNPKACETAVSIFKKSPSTAALYGANKLIDLNGKKIGTFKPMPFDLLRLLKCELVPTANGSFYNLEICRNEFLINSKLKTCGDFGLWLKLSNLPILSTYKVLASTRVDSKSSTRQAINYDQFCADKIYLIEQFCNKFEDNILTQSILKTSIAGVYAWAAESVLNIEGKSKKFYYYIKKALSYDPFNQKAQQLKIRIKI